MKNRKPTIRELFSALLRLNDISQGKASDLSGLTRQNVSSWCTGRDNAISQKSQLKLLATLGVSYGSLRSESVYRWCVNDVGDAALVLDGVLNEEERAQAEFWHVHNLLYPGCIVLKITKQTRLIWVMMYRPLMAEPPQPIKEESLRCGVDRGEVTRSCDDWTQRNNTLVVLKSMNNYILNELIPRYARFTAPLNTLMAHQRKFTAVVIF